ncbi:outer membrane protein [Aminobacter niigataensis]|uniref:outer membrane protein n=1 Tax=Aminobacter niigataensis TaxID=83265 RepID=UPI0024CC4145|nr:outer membrane protein [Aminobacter niigataensis]CAI2931871.1 Adhesin/invasin protein PagN [Aminobacter niigataensis]
MKYSAAITLVLLSTNSVIADDTFVWSGAYAGLQAGYGSGSSTYIVDIFPNLFIPYDPKGFFGGAYAGYNVEVKPGWIAGVEADLSAGGLESGRTTVLNPRPTHEFGHADIVWQGALRARLGYDAGRVLPFATAGLALATYQHSVENEYIYDGFNRTTLGWTIGAGFDYALTNRLIARAEYRFSDYGTDHYDRKFVGGALSHEVDLATQDVRIGLAYKF